MSAPISPEEVCNLSLDLLRSGEQVTDISSPEGTIESMCARWYDITRQSALRQFPFNFARERANIPKCATDPLFGYPDAYLLPNDYLGYVFVGEEAEGSGSITDFRIEGGKLLVDNDGASSLPLCYIKDVTDVAKFDPIFLNYLVGELAMVFGNSITGLNKSLGAMEKFRDRWEAKARAKNGQENPPRIRFQSAVLSARRRGRRSTSSDGKHLFS